MRILIKGGRVIDPVHNRDEIIDILIENGIIEEIEKDIDLGGAEIDIIDAGGLIVCPGLIDMHCHLRDPGYEYKEDIESGAKSAVAGGFTSIACMPNTDPAIDNEAIINYINDKAKASGYANVYSIGAVSKGRAGEQLAEIGEMKFAGAVAVSDDGDPISNAGLMRQALIYASMFEIPVICHCEEKTLLDDGVMNEGAVATAMGLRGISNSVEEVMVSRDVIIAENEGLPVHIAHVSTAGSVEIIRQAKKRGVRVTAETCPHYFTLTDETVLGYNTNAKINPPLRTAKDVAAIKEGLRDGTIDVIATDHAPHHEDEKNCEFDYAANGIIGFETALALGITHLVRENVLSTGELIEKMSKNPASILSLNKGTIGLKRPADITIFSPDEQVEITEDKIVSKSKNTPFLGSTLFGKVVYTIVGGKIVLRMGELM